MALIGKSMNLYELSKKLTVARKNGFVFNQVNKLTKKLFAFKVYKHKLLSKVPYTKIAPTIFQNRNMKKTFAMIWKIFSTLHVEIGSLN